MTEYTYSDELISDLHKDANGFRPREAFWNGWNSASPEEKQTVWDGLLMQMVEREAEMRRMQDKGLRELKANLRRVMNAKGVDWCGALRWLMQSENEPDMEHFLWKQGVSWAKNNEIQRLFMAAKETA